MKTLANCAPAEFLRQCNKIRHVAADLLKDSGVLEIRKHHPEFTGGETEAEKKAMMDAQAKKNLSDMADALMDNHAEQTAVLLGMMCFLEPEEVPEAKGVDFLTPAMELINSKPVMDFLLSLAKLGQTNTGA